MSIRALAIFTLVLVGVSAPIGITFAQQATPCVPTTTIPPDASGDGPFHDSLGNPTSNSPTDGTDPGLYSPEFKEAPMDQSTFDKLTDYVEAVDPGMASEMQAAYSAGTVGFMTNTNDNWANHGRYDHEGTTVIISTVNAGTAEQATTLMHEWVHMRHRNGYGNCPKVAWSSDFCGHAWVYAMQLEAMCELIGFIEDEYWDAVDAFLANPGGPANPDQYYNALTHARIKSTLGAFMRNANYCPASQGGPPIPSNWANPGPDGLPCSGLIALFGPK